MFFCLSLNCVLFSLSTASFSISQPLEKQALAATLKIQNTKSISHASRNYNKKTMENKDNEGQIKQSNSEDPHRGLAKTVMSSLSQQQKKDKQERQ
jgi:hypothetical protein